MKKKCLILVLITMVGFFITLFFSDKNVYAAENDVVVNPIAKYEFNDSSNPGKDSMGNYDLNLLYAAGYDSSNGGVSVSNGVASFNGTAGLVSGSNENDISEKLGSFTLTYNIKSTVISAAWVEPIGFGWNDWHATKWFTFMYANDTNLRFTTASSKVPAVTTAGDIDGKVGDVDGNGNQFWGPTIADISTEKTITITVELGGNIVAYVDGNAVLTYKTPENYSLSDPTLQFAMGCSAHWGGQNWWTGELSNVAIYDFAFNYEQTTEYLNNGFISDSDLDLGVMVNPIANYEFKDATNPGKDTMGNYNLIVKPAVGYTEGTVSINNGVAVFNGTAGLVSESESTDISEELSSFTLCFEINQTANPTSWVEPIGFGWDGFACEKYFGFQVAPDESKLRFGASGLDETSGAYWWHEAGTISSDSYSKIILSVNPGEKVTVYNDKTVVYSYDIPADYSLKNDVMRFSLGGLSMWGNIYNPYVGSIRNVKIYDFAFDEAEVNEYHNRGNLYREVGTYVKEAIIDLSNVVCVPFGSSNEEILALAPESSEVSVIMSDNSIEKVNIKWSSVEIIGGAKYLVGEIPDLENINKVKAYGKISFIKNGQTLLPIALYEFKDSENPGKDTMGNYDLIIAYAPNYDLSNGGISISNGVANFNGTAGLISGHEENDLSNNLKSFTMAFTISGNETYPEGWGVPIGFGWDDWYANKWFTFELENGSPSELRFTAASSLDNTTGLSDVNGADNQWWGPVVANIQNEKRIVVSVELGGNIIVYADGSQVLSYKTPENFTMNDSTMQFAIGCSGFHVSTARPFVGNISNVAIYDVALTKEQVEVLSLENEITTGIATEPYIASVDNVVKFDGNITKNLLTSNMSLDEMLEELNSSWVDATLSDSSKMQLPITWTYVQKNGDVYKAFGYARATHLGVLSVTNFVPVEQVLEVHTFGTPTYSWSEDFSKCTATMVSDLDPNITITETVNSSKDVVESTTDTKGKITYKAEFSNEVFETQTHEEELDLLEPENQPDNNPADENNKPNDNLGNEDNQSNNIIVPVIIGSVCLLGLIVGFLLFMRKRKK